MNTKTIEFKKKDVIAAYDEAMKNGNTITVAIFEQVFGKGMFKPKDIKERIKTFEDACTELGSEHPLVEEYETIISRCGGLSADILAYMKLRIIVAALNEGWQPQFTEDEWRHFPWFYLYTQKEIDGMDEEQKSRVVFRSNSSAFAIGGVAFAIGGMAFAHTVYDSSHASASIGSRLVFKSSELAKYAGEQFIEIWADYIFKAE